MVNFELTNTHSLVILNIDGKAPLRVSSSSIYFHNANDLLCCAVAACLGNNLKRLCVWEEINPRLFQTITVELHNNTIEVRIKCPKTLEQEKRENIINDLKQCSISKLLSIPFNIKFVDIDTTEEELVKEKPKGCCGG